MLSQLEERILRIYQEGRDLNYMVEKLNIPYELIIKTLLDYKELHRLNKSFTDSFKKMIAERDMSDISRRQIAKELKINANTVKKACEEFGQARKDKAESENEYTKVEGNFPLTICPSCKSEKVNLVDEDTTYCKSCGSEHIHKKEYALKINWEYID